MSNEGAPTEDEINRIVAAEVPTETEDLIPVILAIHTGAVIDNVPQFASIRYMLPVSVLQDIRGSLSPFEAV